MEVSRILSEIDAQIEKLQQARALLAGVDAQPVPVVGTRRRGRPRGSKNASSSSAASAPASKTATRRKLTPEGRKRIAEAMKQRWAERKKEAAK